MKQIWKRRWFLVALAIGYCGTYAGLRFSDILVHRVTYADAGSKSYHSIVVGDPGITLSGTRKSTAYMIIMIIVPVYYPLRLIESSVWKLIPREYEF